MLNRPKLLTCFLFSFLLLTMGLPAERIFFLGHPRSGNHWMTYILVRLLDKPCVSHPAVGPFFWMSREWKKQDYLDDPLNQPVILHAHNPYDVGMHLVNFEDDWLIFILRDYKETLMSDNYDNEANVLLRLKHEGRFKEDAYPFALRENSYINDLRCYDLWNPDKRILIYYEDLMNEPAEVLTELALALDVSQERLDSFLENLEAHQIQCFNRSFTKKKNYFDVKRHTKKMSPKAVRTVDRFFQQQFPIYWERYLNRYKG